MEHHHATKLRPTTTALLMTSILALALMPAPASAAYTDTIGVFCDPDTGLCVSGAGASNCANQVLDQTEGERDSISAECSTVAMCGPDVEWQIEAKLFDVGNFKVKWIVGCDGVGMESCYTNSTEGAGGSVCASAGITGSGELYCKYSLEFHSSEFTSEDYEAKCVDPMRPDRVVPAVRVIVNETADHIP